VVIHDQFGAVAGKVTTPSLAANETLPLGVAIANEAYSCTVTSTASNAVNLRRVLDIRDISGNVLINSNLK
jgi:hypothetical protein